MWLLTLKDLDPRADDALDIKLAEGCQSFVYVLDVFFDVVSVLILAGLDLDLCLLLFQLDLLFGNRQGFGGSVPVLDRGRDV